MRKTLPADSEILQYLYRDGGVRGERIALRFRWLLVGLVLALIGVMYAKGLIMEASWPLVPVSIFIDGDICLSQWSLNAVSVPFQMSGSGLFSCLPF